jgi:hypothetical protein
LPPELSAYPQHETAKAAQVSEDHIAKAVIVKDAAGYAMVVVPASNWVEVEHLRKELNRDFHPAPAGSTAPAAYQDPGNHITSKGNNAVATAG